MPYADDLGFTATGDVRDGVLYHEHLVLYRKRDARRSWLQQINMPSSPRISGLTWGNEK
ncbi:Atu4866 domain-containing protein [Streptosporangium album]|uniref:Atu4866 domain-containing protein n=1 Tax=Streptosporangium album TaxID=47479 RepID=UPI001608ACD6